MDIRKAELSDIPSILHIYNQGIEDRVATLELQAKDETYMTAWFEQRKERFVVLVAVLDDAIAGWASINPYSLRCAYDGVGDISIYIHRDYRGSWMVSLWMSWRWRKFYSGAKSRVQRARSKLQEM